MSSNAFRSVLLLSLMAAAFTARATTLVFQGDTTGGPTFDPYGFGDADPYAKYEFTIGDTDTFSFSSASLFDNSGFLYEGSFDPSNPHSNLIAANDDGPLGTDSFFTYDLTAGTSYTFVITGFDNSEYGAFTTTITNERIVTTPGPAAALPFALCLLRRKRKSVALASGVS